MAEAISSVIGCSHRTILVLSENYLNSEWCRFELQAALRESAVDRQHKIIAVLLEPNCLLEMSPEMRSLLNAAAPNSLLYSSATGTGSGLPNGPNQQPQQQQQQPQQLVQLADASANSSWSSGVQRDSTSANNAPDDSQQQLPQHQLIATLTRQSGGNQQVSTQTMQLASSRITFINYNERKFWPKLKQLMPVARPSAPVALTLTTKN